ncbi:hypothetical protein QJS04_geneDACA011604 [Acorus gramineus]|uniref:Uncharacterized protein n=1 Tax=Acorus gramineus TaxID=55184 RepID=A0AAV9A0H9_ACOGR|nr:hypothetical protein QJS04_geneDACA011604 [Acorus gramineus]
MVVQTSRLGLSNPKKISRFTFILDLDSMVEVKTNIEINFFSVGSVEVIRIARFIFFFFLFAIDCGETMVIQSG